MFGIMTFRRTYKIMAKGVRMTIGMPRNSNKGVNVSSNSVHIILSLLIF